MLRRQRGDDGVILVFALIFLGVIALVVTSVISFSTTGVRSVSTSRADLAKRYAVDAALKYAVQQVRVESESCNQNPNPLTPPAGFLTSSGGPFSANTAVPQVAVTCTVTGDATTYGAAGYALVVNDSSDIGLRVSGASSADRLPVQGPSFVAARAASGALDIPLAVTGGNFYGLSVSSSCPPRPNELTTQLPFGYACLDARPNPVVTLPDAAPTQTRGPDPVVTLPGGCAVYLPGKYTAINLAPHRDIYFASGVYYFENVDVEVRNNQTLVGGRYVSTLDVESSGTPCASDADVPIGSGVTGTGVKIVLGGTSRFWADAGIIELYSRQGPDLDAATPGIQTDEGTAGVSILTVTAQAVAAAPSAGWRQSCQVAPGAAGSCASDNTAFVIGAGATNAGETCTSNVGGGQQTSFVVHGLLHAPSACVRLRSQRTEIKLLGGVVAGRLHIGTSANVGGFNIRVPASVGPRTMRIVATAIMPGDPGNRTLTATADLNVNHATGEVAISRWVTPL